LEIGADFEAAPGILHNVDRREFDPTWVRFSIVPHPRAGRNKRGEFDHMRPLPIVEKDGVLVIALEDGASLNEGQAIGLRQVLYTALDVKKEAKVAIDMSAIDYISSTGIALLIGTKRRVEAGQGHLVLFGLQPDVHELFQVMKLVNLFEIASDEAKAMELLTPPLSN